MSPHYTIMIEAVKIEDGRERWEAVTPPEGIVYDGTALDVARMVADRQMAVTGDNWRVRVWLGAEADVHGAVALAEVRAAEHLPPLASWRYDKARSSWVLRGDDGTEYGAVDRIDTVRAEGTVIRWVPYAADGTRLDPGYQFPHAGWARVEEHAGLLGCVHYRT